jgi:hypothetical protein
MCQSAHGILQQHSSCRHRYFVVLIPMVQPSTQDQGSEWSEIFSRKNCTHETHESLYKQRVHNCTMHETVSCDLVGFRI